jgi:hypothetical protein
MKRIEELWIYAISQVDSGGYTQFVMASSRKNTGTPRLRWPSTPAVFQFLDSDEWFNPRTRGFITRFIGHISRNEHPRVGHSIDRLAVTLCNFRVMNHEHFKTDEQPSTLISL